MTICKLCGKQTDGSTGAAGIRWKSICQECKDQEDKALDRQLNYLADVFRITERRKDA
jgi:ribosome-binding protein aMBF1 (putative translation factor)